MCFGGKLLAIIVIYASLVLLTMSNIIEIKLLSRSRVHDVLEKIIIITGGAVSLWCLRFHVNTISQNEEYLLVAALLYFVVFNRLVVYFICNRLTKGLRNKNT